MRPEKKITRRKILKTAAQAAGAIGVAAVIGKLSATAGGEPLVWQLDPEKCTQCGLCATECVLPTSAVKCVHAFDICGYCDYCTGFLEVYAQERNQAAENQLCPTNAISRRFVHEPYFEYDIDVQRCVGCGKCVKGCRAFGNASLYLQVFHDRCVNCNQCAIAAACPAMAFERLPASQPYKARRQYNTPPKPAEGEAT